MNGGEPPDVKDGPRVTKLTYDTQKAIDGLPFIHGLCWKHRVSPLNNDPSVRLPRTDPGAVTLVWDLISRQCRPGRQIQHRPTGTSLIAVCR
jgi:hypothetical protein